MMVEVAAARTTVLGPAHEGTKKAVGRCEVGAGDGVIQRVANCLRFFLFMTPLFTNVVLTDYLRLPQR